MASLTRGWSSRTTSRLRGIVSPLTPESWEHLNPRSSQGATLRRGLSAVIAWGTLVVVSVVALAIAPGSTVGGRGLGVLLAAVCAAAGVAWRQRPWGAWLSLAGLAIVLLVGLLSPGTRFDVLVMGTYTVTFLAIFVSSRRVGLACVAVGVIVMAVVATRSDVRVDVGSVTIDVGSVAIAQMVVAGLWLWWAWHAALAQADRRDAIAVEQEHAIEASLTLQERTRAWREAVTRTHETILNDLRYVLRTPILDRERFRDQLLTTRDRRADPPVDRGVLVDRLRMDFPGEVVVRDDTREPGAAWAAEVQPVLVEVVRNIARHTDANRIVVTAERIGADYRITVDDDGSAESAADRGATPGIGRSVVVEDSLAALDARLEETLHRCVITLPRGRRTSGSGGRVLLAVLSIVLVSSALGGSIQFVLLAVGASTAYVLVAVAAVLLTALSAVIVIRGHLIGLRALVPASVLAAFVPWGMALAPQACAAPPLMLTTVNLSLNALFASLLWSRSRWAWVLVVPALIGVLALGLLPGVACPLQAGDVLLSSAVLMPVLITVSWLNARSVARWESQDQQRWEKEITERARAEVDIDLAHALDDSIDLAWSLMWEVADGAEFDDERRRQLRTVDSAIRSSLQVDPRTAGGMVLAAREVIACAVSAGFPLHVRSLRASSDPRPLAPELVAALAAMVASGSGGDASIHVFGDDHDDYLTVTASAVSAARAGFVPGWDEDWAGCRVEVEYIEDEPDTAAEVTVIVSRSILLVGSVSADPASMVG